MKKVIFAVLFAASAAQANDLNFKIDDSTMLNLSSMRSILKGNGTIITYQGGSSVQLRDNGALYEKAIANEEFQKKYFKGNGIYVNKISIRYIKCTNSGSVVAWENGATITYRDDCDLANSALEQSE